MVSNRVVNLLKEQLTISQNNRDYHTKKVMEYERLIKDHQEKVAQSVEEIKAAIKALEALGESVDV
jgi:hypothetical protein